MTKTKNTKAKVARKKGSSAARQRTLPKGEKVAGLTPAIPFCEPKGDDDVEPDRVSIKLCLDDSAADKNSKRNFETKSFNRIDLFTLKGLEEVLKLRCALDIDIYKPYGLTDPKSVDR